MDKPELNTVMSWLEGLADDDWADLHSDTEVQNIAKAALELLEEQDNQIHHMALIIEEHEKEIKKRTEEASAYAKLLIKYGYEFK